MGRLKYNTPLTSEERVFAAENAYFIDWYIRKHHLDYDEWYDVLAIAYLKSVKKWFAEHELHKYKFSTIAGRTLHYAFMKEYEIKKQEFKTISLFQIVPGWDEDITFMELITYENLNRIYLEGEVVNISLDVKIPEDVVPATRGPKSKSKEIFTLEAFLETNHKNICFEYDTSEEAVRKRLLFADYRKRHKLQNVFDIRKRRETIYIIRL